MTRRAQDSVDWSAAPLAWWVAVRGAIPGGLVVSSRPRNRRTGGRGKVGIGVQAPGAGARWDACDRYARLAQGVDEVNATIVDYTREQSSQNEV